MTVGKLIKLLKGLPQDAVVVQARDPEGNGFESTHDVQFCRFDPKEREVYQEDDDRGVDAVCLWP